MQAVRQTTMCGCLGVCVCDSLSRWSFSILRRRVSARWLLTDCNAMMGAGGGGGGGGQLAPIGCFWRVMDAQCNQSLSLRSHSFTRSVERSASRTAAMLPSVALTPQFNQPHTSELFIKQQQQLSRENNGGS